jgi:hypothetical protein
MSAPAEFVARSFVGDASADPDLWGFCGDAAAQETVVLDGAGADDRGLPPKPRPPPTGPAEVNPSAPATASWRGPIARSDRGMVTFSAKGAPNADYLESFSGCLLCSWPGFQVTV